jgi:hypothetical protein
MESRIHQQAVLWLVATCLAGIAAGCGSGNGGLTVPATALAGLPSSLAATAKPALAQQAAAADNPPEIQAAIAAGQTQPFDESLLSVVPGACQDLTNGDTTKCEFSASYPGLPRIQYQFAVAFSSTSCWHATEIGVGYEKSPGSGNYALRPLTGTDKAKALDLRGCQGTNAPQKIGTTRPTTEPAPTVQTQAPAQAQRCGTVSGANGGSAEITSASGTDCATATNVTTAWLSAGCRTDGTPCSVSGFECRSTSTGAVATTCTQGSAVVRFNSD